MSFRIGFDIDGVLADFTVAFREVEARLFDALSGAGEPAREEEEQEQIARRGVDVIVLPADEDRVRGEEMARASPRETRRRRDAAWQAIQSTPNFWRSLSPLEPGAVRRIHELMLRHGWEVVFLTRRPPTVGDTVQRQTQLWLAEQGFDLPSVLVLGGSRGSAAAALRLDYHVDDSAQNCLDVLSDSGAKPILVVADGDEATINSARKLGIGTARSIAECLDILEQATVGRHQPGVLQKLASLVGWKE